jgi:hypothetical protein
LYRFVGNNATNAMDPSGLRIWQGGILTAYQVRCAICNLVNIDLDRGI